LLATQSTEDRKADHYISASFFSASLRSSSAVLRIVASPGMSLGPMRDGKVLVGGVGLARLPLAGRVMGACLIGGGGVNASLYRSVMCAAWVE
jgi:hypothetical protein